MGGTPFENKNIHLEVLQDFFSKIRKHKAMLTNRKPSDSKRECNQRNKAEVCHTECEQITPKSTIKSYNLAYHLSTSSRYLIAILNL
jgi:hypothetical protein